MNGTVFARRAPARPRTMSFHHRHQPGGITGRRARFPVAKWAHRLLRCVPSISRHHPV